MIASIIVLNKACTPRLTSADFQGVGVSYRCKGKKKYKWRTYLYFKVGIP